MTKSASLLYVVAWVALGLFGVYFQCKRDDGKKIRRGEKNDDDYKKMKEVSNFSLFMSNIFNKNKRIINISLILLK